MHKKILFVTHECSATGAPLLFLNIINELKKRDIFSDTDVYAIKGGTLLGEFKMLGRFSLNDSFPRDLSTLNGISEQIYDIIYFNTVESVHLIPLFRLAGIIKSKTKIICHIHELDGTVKKAGTECIEIIKENVNAIICVSSAVRNNLIRYKVNPNAMIIVNPFLIREMNFISNTIRENLNYTVLGCGEITIVKGVDIFLQVAKSVCKKSSSIMFNWVGADTYKIRQYFEKDIELWGLTNQIQFSGFHDDPSPFFYSSNLFFLSSRQDSFPLVCIEAAYSGLPVMHFPDAGGIKELLDEKCSIHLDYLNIDDATEKIIDLNCNKHSCEKLSQEAFSRVNNKCSRLNSISKILKVINNV